MTGIFFALTAAAFWALATRLFRSMSSFWSPASLALIKSLVSVALFGIWFWLAGKPIFQQEPETIVYLMVSGVIGIAVGDTALFIALYRMGERQTLLVAETAAPVFVLFGAFIFLAEQVTLVQLFGVALVIFGVDWVIGLRGGRGHFDAIGVFWALLAAICQCFGVLVSRLFLVETNISAEETAFWRIAGACMALPLWLFFRKQSLRPALPVNLRIVSRLLVGILLGTFFGILFLQMSIALLPAALAQTLIATSILFAVIFAAVRRESVTGHQWVGVVIAIAGIAVISKA